jgi:glutamyl-tRNA synthetase
LGHVGRSGAKFDEQRLNWMNGHYIRELPIDELYVKAEAFWPKSAAKFDDAYKKQVLGLMQERLKYLAELPSLTEFFFTDLPVDKSLIESHKKLSKMDKDDLKTLLVAARSRLEESDFTAEDLTNRLNALLTITHTQPAVLFSLIRIATTQAPASPGLAETLAVLGKDLSLKRLDQQIAAL